MAPLIFVRLVGALAISDANGRDCTPRGGKARGLIALLCLSPDRRRTRRWLESRLWSDRGADQASGSLRQVLVEVRAALGTAAGCLRTDREMIELLSAETDLEADPAAARAALEQGRELFEGIELKDPAFVAWKADQLARFVQGAAPKPVQLDLTGTGLPLLLQTGELPSGVGGFVALSLADAIGGLVSEFATVDLYGTQGALVQLGPPERGLALSVEARRVDAQLHLMVHLRARRSGQVMWSRQAVLPLDAPDLLSEGAFPGIVFEAAEAALSALPRLSGEDTTTLRTEAMVAQAVREMFSFDASRLVEADRLLLDVERVWPTPRVFAWHALLRQIMAVEQIGGSREVLFTEADIFARKAMEGAPDNPLVLALVSQVRVMLDGNPDAGSALARDAVARSPSNAHAYAAQAGSLLRIGKYEQAFAAAQRGTQLASRSSFLQWWESLGGLTQVAMGDHEGAIRSYEAAHARAPNFRSPLRHLLFLYMATGQTEKAVRVLADLRRVEPDFSLARIREDPDYPAGTLRRTGLLKLSLPD